jgi:heptosyltransferase II
MKILVRMPNWLGDVIMSSAFFDKLNLWAPHATIDVIIKEELLDIIPYIPNIRKTHILTRQRRKSLKTEYKFAREIASKENYDVYFSLPDSFSSALIGFFSGAKKRIGYKNGLRSFLLTKSILKPTDLHRVEEYILLAKLFFKKHGSFNGRVVLKLKGSISPSNQSVPAEYIVFNGASEASSRTIPLLMAVNLINRYIEEFNLPIVFPGKRSNYEYYSFIISQVDKPEMCINLSENTNLDSLVQIMNGAKIIVSTDSGPAHLGNALNKKLLVIFGAGNEFNTGPYNQVNSQIIRTSLECTPCVSNRCKFDGPKCLLDLDINDIVKRTRNLIGRSLVQETE